MFKQTLITLTLVGVALSAHAQSTPAKKELVAKILKIQQPGIEAMARGLVEEPVADLLGKAAAALPARVPADKREAVAKDIQADAKKFIDESAPLVRDRAVKLAPSTIGALLEEKLSEDELRQVVAIIESPVYGKFQQLGGEMQKVLIEKLLADTRGTVEPKLRTLEQSVARRLGVSAADKPAAAPAKPAAKPANK